MTGDVVVDDLLLVLNPVRNLPNDYPQHPEKKQRMRLKKPQRWGVCGDSAEVDVSDDTMVTGTSTLLVLVLVLVLVSFVFIS